MIIRKPYKFIIKNFKVIHLVMLLLSFFVLFNSVSIYNILNNYVSSRTMDTNISITSYIGFLYKSCLILITLLSCTIYVLFKKKRKPVTYYLIHIIMLISLFVFANLVINNFNGMLDNSIDTKVSRLLRDMSLILMVVQVPFMIIELVRGLGFNAKKFNFGEDLAQIRIDEQDNEEVEIKTDFNNERIKMLARMKNEDLKLFYDEYKIFIWVIVIVLVVVIPGILISNMIKANVKYKSNEVIEIGGFNFEVLDTYVTKKEYDGDLIYNSSNTLLVVKIALESLSNETRFTSNNYIRLKVNDSIYLSDTSLCDELSDLGTCYTSQDIVGRKEYILIYKINEDVLNNELILRVTESLNVDKEGKLVAKYFPIVLNYSSIDKDIEKVLYNVGEEMVLPTSNASLTINSIEVNDYYSYTYSNKNLYIINTTGSVLKLNYSFNKDDNYFIKNVDDLLTKYTKLVYVYNNKTYIKDISFMNSTGYSNNDLFISVSSNINDASSIYLLTNLRDYQYVYRLK